MHSLVVMRRNDKNNLLSRKFFNRADFSLNSIFVSVESTADVNDNEGKKRMHLSLQVSSYTIVENNLFRG